MDEPPTLVVDARGHHCPVPTLRLRKALERVGPGQRVLLLANDPMARVDVPHFAAEAGHTIVGSEDVRGGLSFLVEKRGAAPRS
ncbi:MAG: sulfurtransferase TusA family protein [Caulobacteraceae bacterium]|nr:sulfurtransferase TusA family protein [Caulobacteraceae bacterium]